MISDPHNFEEAVFTAALHLPAEVRPSYLSMVCGGDVEMRHRLETRLNACPATQDDSAETESFPASPALDPDATVTSEGVLTREEMIGQTIGRYRLVEKLGEGGFGSVYVAEQDEPVKRRVAFKITKLGMDTKQVVARFKVERQALARMDHPGIAKVLDAGATQTGRPYFVMELVQGIKITEYCDQNKLSTHKRLELFIQVCRAIEHAHQKGIIHRDIKPSNILIAKQDGHPTPKVIDFGIAKATRGALSDHPAVTQFDQFVGTPAYMSPEQAEMGGQDVDTRTDIYSLGVLLYELLTSQTPIESKNLLARGIDEMRKMIKEFEPPLPSMRLGRQKEGDSSSTAQRHGTDAPKLLRLVKGDLDWVVMKCLEKDRARRYDTAGSLAADVQRVLDDQPVEARPPSKVYHFQKLVRRNKLVFALGFSMWAASVVGLSWMTWLVLSEKAERDRAQMATVNANMALHKAEFAKKQSEEAEKQAESDRKNADQARTVADESRLKAEAALQESKDERAKAQTANQRADEADKHAKEALAQAQAEREKAEAAVNLAKDAQTKLESARHDTQVAESRFADATAQAEKAAKATASETLLRRDAEMKAAAALAQTGQWRGAVTNLLTSLNALPPGDALKAANLFFSPEDSKQPWAAMFLRARGDWRARHGDGAEAIADFTESLKLEPSDSNVPARLAPLLAESGTPESYGRYCGHLFKDGRATNDEALAFDCLLAPTADIGAQTLGTPPSGASPSQPARQLLQSLAQYRQGHFSEAADLASNSLSATNALNDGRMAEGKAILALAQQKLNQPENARAALGQAHQILDTKMPKPEAGDMGVNWPDWMGARVLLREAQASVAPQTAGP